MIGGSLKFPYQAQSSLSPWTELVFGGDIQKKKKFNSCNYDITLITDLSNFWRASIGLWGVMGCVFRGPRFAFNVWKGFTWIIIICR